MTQWTNESAIEQWGTMPRAALDAMEPHGDFVKRHLLNPVMLRLLGDVRGRRVLDAGCGQGYFSRMLAERGAEVTGVEPAEALIAYSRDKEAEHHQGIRYLQADLSKPLDLAALGGPFDAVVSSNVLPAVPGWKAVLAAVTPAGRQALADEIQALREIVQAVERDSAVAARPVPRPGPARA